jgi:hypothetical protein
MGLSISWLEVGVANGCLLVRALRRSVDPPIGTAARLAPGRGSGAGFMGAMA